MSLIGNALLHLIDRARDFEHYEFDRKISPLFKNELEESLEDAERSFIREIRRALEEGEETE